MNITICDICEATLNEGHPVICLTSEKSSAGKSVDLCPECYGRFLKLLCRGFSAETPEDKPFTLEELHWAFEEHDYGYIGYAVDLQDAEILAALIDEYPSGIVAVWNADGHEDFLEKDYGKTWVFFRTRSGAESWLEAEKKRKEESGK